MYFKSVQAKHISAKFSHGGYAQQVSESEASG